MDECFEVDFILDSKPGMIQDDLGWFSEHVHSITVLQSWSTMNLALLLNIHLIPSQFLQMLGYSLISQLTTITANQDSLQHIVNQQLAIASARTCNGPLICPPLCRRWL